MFSFQTLLGAQQAQAGCLQPATKETEHTLCSLLGKLCDWTVRKPDNGWMYAMIYATHGLENSMN